MAFALFMVGSMYVTFCLIDVHIYMYVYIYANKNRLNNGIMYKYNGMVKKNEFE